MMKLGRKLLPVPVKARIKSLLGQQPAPPPVLPDALVLSYPKCGRTWLRVMLGQALSLYFEDESLLSMLLDGFAVQPPVGLSVGFSHDDDPHHRTPDELATDKSTYRDCRVVFLVRDPRDVFVSYYFERTRREPALYGQSGYNGDMAAYIDYDRGSIDTMLHFYNIWAENRHVPADFLLLRYEDLTTDGEKQLRRLLDFLEVRDVSEEIIREAVEFAHFENMRRMEQKAAFDSSRLRPGDAGDRESYKVRRGKVGGYVDYLADADIARLDERIITQLDDFYSFYRYRTPKS